MLSVSVQQSAEKRPELRGFYCDAGCWDGVFGRMVKTDAWRQAVEKNQWEEDYLNSADLGKSLKAQFEVLKDVLTEIGMAK